MKFSVCTILSLWSSSSLLLAVPTLADDATTPRNLRQQSSSSAGRELAEGTKDYVYNHVKITATNLAPTDGTCQAPVWVGIHDGKFDMFNQGSRASDAIESLAEDGDASMLANQFAITRGTLWETTLPSGGPLCPGESVTYETDLVVPKGAPYFLSYATMVLPSNDAFLANPSPRAYKVLNNQGKSLTPVTITEMGTDVWDAGTEINDEKPMNTAGLAQSMPNVGVTEWDAIRPHKGFKAKGMGGILDTPGYTMADFTQPGYEMMKIYIEISETKQDGAGMGGGHSPMMMNP